MGYDSGITLSYHKDVNINAVNHGKCFSIFVSCRWPRKSGHMKPIMWPREFTTIYVAYMYYTSGVVMGLET